MFLGMLEQLVAAVEEARNRRAHVDHVLAHRLAFEHLVEARGAQHFCGREIEQLGDVLHRVLGEVAVLLLREVTERKRRRLAHGIAADDLLRELFVLRIEPRHYLSTSPMIGSTEEMTATPSARNPPRIMWGSVCRFTKLGPRMRMRYGRDVPLLTR